ncbi:hypothetical protein DFH27DRAFT_559804 [Peziza echinospora]|nr:hypothetical protein DFH27DRAFT_559804 [Peziza echinospora]
MLMNGMHTPPGSTTDSLFAKLHDTGVWRDAPVLVGTTKFEPSKDMKNIMVTGGEGFIACWLVRHLVLTYPEYNIFSFDKLDYCASLNNTRVLDAEPNFKFIHGDITQPEQVMYALGVNNIDTILHFAAQSHVDLSFGNSYQFTSTNVYGTHVLLECAKSHGVKKFIHVSTDEVYGEVDEDGDDLTEASILAPTNPYAASKAAAEMLVNAYWKSFKLPVIIVRSNNVYGPHQFPEKVIPKFICLLDRGSKLLVHGDGKHTRRYLYAGDAADAFDTILHKGLIGQAYNVGSTYEISNLELCSLLLKEFGYEDEDLSKFVSHTADRPFNDRRYAVDATKLGQLGWSQKTDFAEGLKQTVEWYKRYGSTWWGDIENVLQVPFPVVHGARVIKGGVGNTLPMGEEKIMGN